MALGPIPDNQLAQQGSSIVVEELDAPSGNQPRRLVLTGAGMPFQGAPWSAGNNVKTRWYPGNGAEASQQLLGPLEKESTWEGEWNRTLLGRTPVLYSDEFGLDSKIVSPATLVGVLEGMLRGGSRLRVSWITTGTEIAGDGFSAAARPLNVTWLREGRSNVWEFKPDRIQDIKWSITWDWASRGGSLARVVDASDDSNFARGADALEAANNALAGAIDASLKSAFANIRSSATQFTLGQLEAIADYPQALTASLSQSLERTTTAFQQAVAIADKFANTPASIAAAARAMAANTTAVVRQFEDSHGQIPPEVLTTKSTPSAILRAANYFGNITEGARQVRVQAEQLSGKLHTATFAQAGQGAGPTSGQTTQPGGILAIHVCRAGDTPWTVSQRYYKTPDRYLDVLRANRLSWYTPAFERGQVLYIPSTPPPAPPI